MIHLKRFAVGALIVGAMLLVGGVAAWASVHHPADFIFVLLLAGAYGIGGLLLND